MKTKILILLLVLVLFLTATGVTLANGGPARSRWVLSGGASASSGGSVSLRASLGQPVVGVVTGGELTVGQGFWHGGSVSDDGFNIYLPMLVRRA